MSVPHGAIDECPRSTLTAQDHLPHLAWCFVPQRMIVWVGVRAAATSQQIQFRVKVCSVTMLQGAGLRPQIP